MAAGHRVAKAREQPNDRIPAEAEIGAGDHELVVHHPRDPADLVEPLLMGHARRQLADEIGGGAAARPGAASRSGPASLVKIVAADHRLVPHCPSHRPRIWAQAPDDQGQ